MAELLAPAGSLASLRAAVNAGADAVYIGGGLFGARAYAENPDRAQLIEGMDFCHLRGRKLYLTVNTLLKEDELEHMLYDFLLPYYQNGLDGVIVQDFGVVRFIQTHFPGLDVHASTQMTVTGPDGARLLKEAGITRVVPARELSLAEVRRIIEETGIETETFIHGAMCYSYSGQCLLSSMLGGRSGNRGRCAQPCRLPYRVAKKGAGEPSYLLSMKDMCTVELLPELLDAGIASLKIEGRMKKPEYTAGVVSVYRKYIDLYEREGREGFRVMEDDRRVLQDLYNRGGFSRGYYRQYNGKAMMALSRPNHQGTEAARIVHAGRERADAAERMHAGKSAGASNAGRVTAEALEPLHKGDVLELPGGTEVTLAEEVRESASFQIKLPEAGRGKGAPGKHASGTREKGTKAPRIRTQELQVGGVIFRTRNGELLRQLEDAYIKRDCKEKINGELKIFRGSPAILKIWCGDSAAEVSRDIAEPAENQPTTEETVRRQMQKTGNTPFAFGQLDVTMDEGLFVSVRGLNELRREGLAHLEEAVLKKARPGRETCGQGDGTENAAASGGFNMDYGEDAGAASRDAEGNSGFACESVPEARRTPLSVSVLTREQLEAVLSAGISVDTVYLDILLFGGETYPGTHSDEIRDMIWKIKAAGSKCFLNCPPVFRAQERSLFEQGKMQALMAGLDGFLLHTIDELSYFRDYVHREKTGAVLAADDSLYAFNGRAQEFLLAHGVSYTTMPAELNYRELKRTGVQGREMIVYGHQPLMHSAQCVQKNTAGCTRVPAILYLQDRRNVSFPVLSRCPVCCNTIYNSVPLALIGCQKEIESLEPALLRLSFTVESGEETGRILREYAPDGHTYEKRPGSTRGHFKRGVE